jgi:hypothetical protein
MLKMAPPPHAVAIASEAVGGNSKFKIQNSKFLSYGFGEETHERSRGLA